MKTTLLIDDELVAQAKELDINMSAVAREAIAKRVAELTAAREAGMTLIKLYDQDRQPVSFWGRLVAQHNQFEDCAYLTAKSAIVITRLEVGALNADNEVISRIYPSADELFAEVDTRTYDDPEAAQMRPYDDAFFTAIADAAGTTYHRQLDI